MTLSNAKQGWSALVYSRTDTVDFRLLAAPAYFSPEDEQWAMQYILGTTRNPVLLQQQPRWSIFKNEQYCVIGVTCIVRELLEAASVNALEPNITEDSQPRATYAFIGYVTQLSDHLIEIPAMDLAVFYPPCQYLVERWSEKSYQPQASKVMRSQPSQIATQSCKVYSPLNLNCTSRDIQFWSSDDTERLWFATAQDPLPSSICIGFTDEKIVLETPFLNATLPQVETPYRVRRVESFTPPVPEQPPYPSLEARSQDWDWLEEKPLIGQESDARNKLEAFQDDPVKFIVMEVQEVGEKLLGFVLKPEEEMDLSIQPVSDRKAKPSDSDATYGFAPKDSTSDSEQKWFGN